MRVVVPFCASHLLGEVCDGVLLHLALEFLLLAQDARNSIPRGVCLDPNSPGWIEIAQNRCTKEGSLQKGERFLSLGPQLELFGLFSLLSHSTNSIAYRLLY